MKLNALLVSAASLLSFVVAQNANIGSTPSERFVINASQAQQVIEAAAAKAQALNVPQDIAVTDPLGFLVAFRRMDNAFPGSIDISQKKAKTVALFSGSITSADFYNASQPGMPLYGIEETNNVLVVFGGGLPIFVNGHFIGAVGVSSGTVDQDVQVATAGVLAIGTTGK